MNIEHKFMDTVKKYDMFKPGSEVLLAVSGGVDSMVLVHVMNKYKQELNLKLIVAHLNHSLRAEESDKDENLVRNFCKDNDIPFVCKKMDIKSLAQKLKLGIEECARNERYKFFNEVINAKNTYIATAHNLSDNAETILFNMSRGCSLKGLQGIPIIRENIVRPLLEISKKEIINYAKEKNVAYREDKSNFSLIYNRNKIRHKVIPVLKEINPAFEQAILRLKESLSADEEYLEHQTCKTIENIKRDNGYDVLKFSKLKKALRYRVIRKIVGNIKLETSHLNLIDKIIFESKGAVQLDKNKIVRVKNGTLSLCDTEENKPKSESFEEPFEIKTIQTVDNIQYEIKLLEEEEIWEILKSDKKMFRNLIAYDIISRTAVLRYRKNGDVFQQAGRNGIHKNYKKLMQEYNIDKNERNKLLILANEENILWIEKIGVCESAKVTLQTKKAILIEKRSKHK